MKNEHTFDWAIVGAGASGLQLLYELLQADTHQQLSIVLIDSGDRSPKSWCFWSTDNSQCLPFLVEKSWENMSFVSTSGQRKVQSIAPYQYQYISSEIFFEYFFEKCLPNESRVTWVKDWVEKLQENPNQVEIKTKTGQVFYAQQVADSRPKPANLFDTTSIKQHFKGKVVSFNEPILDDNCMTLMDFSQGFSNNQMAVFHYILPFSPHKALIESTVFSKNEYDDQAYERIWTQYMNQKFPNQQFVVCSDERGTIPMCLHNAEADTRIKKIGVTGGRIKPSTGYAFLRMNEHAKALASGKSQRQASRFLFYDSMLLRVMKHEMEQIPKVMDRLFDRVAFPKILRFLDDKTELREEISLLSKLDIPLFLKHLVR